MAEEGLDTTATELLGVNKQLLMQWKTEFLIHKLVPQQSMTIDDIRLTRMLYLLVTKPWQYVMRSETRSSLTISFAVEVRKLSERDFFSVIPLY